MVSLATILPDSTSNLVVEGALAPSSYFIIISLGRDETNSSEE